ncbi:SRPBCC family protein [Fredinandcohnia humi]
MATLSNEKVVLHEVTINSSLDLVWYAWTISERVSEWFAPQVVVDPVVGGAFELYFIPGNTDGMNTKGCKITKLEDKKTLHFTWKGPDDFNEVMNHEDELTTVQVAFEKVDEDTTKVSIEHVGFKGDASWDEAYNWHQMAWSGVLGSLKSALEKGEGNLCCQPE